MSCPSFQMRRIRLISSPSNATSVRSCSVFLTNILNAERSRKPQLIGQRRVGAEIRQGDNRDAVKFLEGSKCFLSPLTM